LGKEKRIGDVWDLEIHYGRKLICMVRQRSIQRNEPEIDHRLSSISTVVQQPYRTFHIVHSRMNNSKLLWDLMNEVLNENTTQIRHNRATLCRSRIEWCFLFRASFILGTRARTCGVKGIVAPVDSTDRNVVVVGLAPSALSLHQASSSNIFGCMTLLLGCWG
jgi:hypothetical protein